MHALQSKREARQAVFEAGFVARRVAREFSPNELA
jgi:hypothetical protein